MEEVAIEIRLPGQIEPDTLAIPLSDDESAPLSDGARVLDERLGGRLQRLADDGELKGELGETVLLHTEGELNAHRLVVAGIGKLGEVDADTLRTAASAVARQVADVGGTVAWMLDDSLPLPFEEQARAIVEGTLLGSYSPARWKTEPQERRSIERIVLCAADEPGLAEAGMRAATVARWVNFARDLANAPPNELTPAGLAERGAGLDLPHLSSEALEPGRIDELGMGALAAVGRASANGPRLIVLRYDPPSPARAALTLGLVGKAITFDAGGISLKPALKMYDMKGDMAGGAGVIAGTAAVAELGLPVRI